MVEALAIIATVIIAFPGAGWLVHWLATRRGLDPSADPIAIRPRERRTGDVLADLAQREQQIAAEREQVEAAARAGLSRLTVPWGAVIGLVTPLGVGAAGGCETAMVVTTLPLLTAGIAVVVNYAWQAARPDPSSELNFARVTFRLGLAAGLVGATLVTVAVCWFIRPA